MMETGHVMLNIRIDVSDAAALLAAGRRSYARDLAKWVPGMPVLVSDEADEVIPDVTQAVADLLVEAWVRCYMPYTTHGPLIEALDCAEWGDIDSKEWYPNDDDEEDCPTTKDGSPCLLPVRRHEGYHVSAQGDGSMTYWGDSEADRKGD